MALDSVSSQKKISTYGLIFASLFSVIALLLGYKMVVYGIMFGALLNAVNYWVVAAIFRAAFGKTKILELSKGVLFAFYQARFFTMMLIMFAVLYNAGLNFGIGTFLGFLAVKIGMGVVVIGQLLTEEDGV